MAQILIFVGLFVVIIALAEVARRSTVPYPTLMVVAGLLIAQVPGLPPVVISPEVVFLIFLPPILYSAAWNTSWRDFQRNLRPISQLGIVLVLVTTAVVGVAAHALIPGLPWSTAFVLGAIVSPPDAAAATAIWERLRVPSRIVTILEGESLVNDAAGLIAYKVAVAAVVTGAFSLVEAGGSMVFAGVGGIAVGLLCGRVIASMHRRFQDPRVTTALSLLAPYATYLPAELMHVSGVLAVVTAGLVVSRLSTRVFSAEARLQAIPVWEVIILLLNGLIFVLIGIQLRTVVTEIQQTPLTRILAFSAAISLVVILVRIAWVFPAAYLSRVLIPGAMKRDPLPPMRYLAIIAWTGMRGIVSLAAALALPLTIDNGQPFPFRNEIIVITFAVILSTLVLQTLTLPGLIRWLRVEAGDEFERDALLARQRMIDAALIELPPDVYGSEFELRKLQREREALISLRESGQVHDGVFRMLERELDLEEAGLNQVRHMSR